MFDNACQQSALVYPYSTVTVNATAELLSTSALACAYNQVKNQRFLVKLNTTQISTPTGDTSQEGDAAWSSANGSNRDCRGLCAQPTADLSGSAPMPSQAYSLDPQCGLCRMSTSANSFSAPSSQSGSGSHQAVDCNGACQLPGLNRSTILCGQCVRPSELDNVLDDCGNCISEGHPCSCDR